MIIAAVVFVGAVAAVVVVPGEKEPEYQGKKLSAWLDAYCSTNATPVLRDEASAAVRAIGTNGVPWLLRWMRFEHRSWPPELTRFFLRGQNGRGAWRAYLAVNGFGILGREANGAVPELRRMVRNSSEPIAALNAAWCLRNFREGSPTLIAVITNGARRPDVRLVALKALRVEVENDRIALGDEGVKSAAAAVRTCLSDSDLIVRTHATNALRVIAPEVLETNRVDHTNNF